MASSTSFYLVILIACLAASCSDAQISQNYIDPDLPELVPKVFAPGFISHDSIYEFGSIFSKDGNSFFFGVDIDGKAEIRYCKLENRKWTTPITIISDETYGYNDPFLSPTEDRLYYISDRPRDAADTSEDYDIWYSQKTESGWSPPINAGPNINSDKDEYYISFTEEGAMYFASNIAASPDRNRDFDIYSSEKKGDNFDIPKKGSDAINTQSYEADVFVAPDESYIIFCADRGGGLGRGDLYISFKNKDDEWTPSKNMGNVINSEHHELCPFVTADNKYLFYTSDQDIYWVSTNIIESLKSSK